MFYCVPKSVVLVLFKEWLDLTEICKLDTAVCEARKRVILLNYFGFSDFTVSFINKIPYSVNSVYWMLQRNVKGTKVFLTTKEFKYGSFEVFSKFHNSVNLYSKLEEMKINCDLVELESDHSYCYILQSMIKLCLKLNKLELANCFLMDDLTIKPVVKNCGSLRVLMLSNLPVLTDDGMFVIASAVKLLEVFGLSETLNITSKGVEKVMRENVFAHTLILKDNEDFCSGSDKLTLQASPNLKTLSISFPASNTFAVKHLNLQCQGLTSITVNSPDILVALPQLPMLASVSANNSDVLVNAHGQLQYQQYHQYQNGQLALQVNESVTTAVINFATKQQNYHQLFPMKIIFKGMPNLISLSISACTYLFDASLVHAIVLGLRQLKTLKLGGVDDTLMPAHLRGQHRYSYAQYGGMAYNHFGGPIPLTEDEQKYKPDLDLLEMADDSPQFTDALLLPILNLFGTLQRVEVSGKHLVVGEESAAQIIKLQCDPADKGLPVMKYNVVTLA